VQPARSGRRGRQLADPGVPSVKSSPGFWSNGPCSVRTDRWRLIVQAGKGDAAPRVELFDYQTDPSKSATMRKSTRTW
jgi:hypothetical protein